MTELQVGSALGPWRVDAVDPEKMQAFARVLADPNPIHLDPAAAKAAGLGDRVVNQGPASIGYVINMLREAAPAAGIGDLRVRLTANVFGGDAVVAAGQVEAIEAEGGDCRIRCRVWLDVEGGRRALEGTATLILPPS